MKKKLFAWPTGLILSIPLSLSLSLSHCFYLPKIENEMLLILYMHHKSFSSNFQIYM